MPWFGPFGTFSSFLIYWLALFGPNLGIFSFWGLGIPGNSTLPKLQVAQKKLSFPGLFEVPRFIRRKMNGRGRYAKLINWLSVCVGWSRRQWWFSCALKWPREDAAISSSLFGCFRDGTSQVVTTWGRRETYVLLGKIICQKDTEKEIAVFHFCQAIWRTLTS